jgi:hypothetical protein
VFDLKNQVKTNEKAAQEQPIEAKIAQAEKDQAEQKRMISQCM